MSERLIEFLKLIRGNTMGWRDPPSIWNEQIRRALNDGLVRHGFGGVLVLTDAGYGAIVASEPDKPEVRPEK